MTQDELKQQVAEAALNEVLPSLSAETILGIGTGSTADKFIDLLGKYAQDFKGAVASSEASATRLKANGVEVFDLNEVGEMDFYIDGADEANKQLELIKGGGAALTREKIVAACCKTFICIIDDTKVVEHLGAFPLPVEVIPMARSYVAREIVKLGGEPVWREGVTTDNGNHIIDVHGWKVEDAKALETQMNDWPGVVTNGLFAIRPADLLLIGSQDGVKSLSVINTASDQGNYY